MRLAGDLTEIRPHFRKVAPNELRSAGISPTGARAVFAAHGEIFTVPAEKGDIRNLTQYAWRWKSGTPRGRRMENRSRTFRMPRANTRWIFATKAGWAKRGESGSGSPPVSRTTPLVARQQEDRLHEQGTEGRYVDLEKGRPCASMLITYAGPMALDPAWSPDSKWIAYTKKLKSHLHAVFVYSVEQNKTFQITDGMSDAANAEFDKEGKYLYFTASTDTALSNGWLDMSSIQRPVTRSVYLAVLAKDLPSPLAPESDEEKPAAAGDQEAG